MYKAINFFDVEFTRLKKNLRSRYNLAFNKERIEKHYGTKYSIPEVLYIECTNVCNARCVFCYYPKIEATLPRSYMDLEAFEKVVHDYASIGGRRIALTPTVGDPFVDKFFSERMRILDDSKIEKVHLYTNLIKVNRRIQESFHRISNFELSIYVSIAGFDRSAYHRLMGVDKFDNMRDNLKDISEITRRNPNVKLALRLQEYYGSKAAKAEFLEYIERLGLAYKVKTLVDTWGGLVEEEIDQFSELEKRARLRRVGPCHISYTKPVVTVDSKLKLCDCRDVSDELVVGDLSKDTLMDIWRGDKVEEMRSSMYSDNDMAEICKKCEMYVSIFDHKK